VLRRHRSGDFKKGVLRLTKLRIHAIVLALNEEAFIENQLKTLYQFCSGVSVLTQYDRDWYGNAVKPDRTLELVAHFPDPDGKIHLVVRRWPDEAAARNAEMLGHTVRPDRGVMSHGSELDRIRRFHEPPDYFLIVDADEFYDVSTFGRILDYLGDRRPRGMRVTGLQYRFSWNERIPLHVVRHHHFGFLRPGVTFEMRRTVSWNESRLQKLLKLCHMPDASARMFGFIDCPVEVGVFHHGSYLGGPQRLVTKFAKHSHPDVNTPEYVASIATLPHDYVTTPDLPVNIREGAWPTGFLDVRRRNDMRLIER
jgi:hypothetical protein